MVRVLLSIFFLNNLFGASQDPTYLVFNHFDKEIPDAEKLLIENFNDSGETFINGNRNTIRLFQVNNETKEKDITLHPDLNDEKLNELLEKSEKSLFSVTQTFIRNKLVHINEILT